FARRHIGEATRADLQSERRPGGSETLLERNRLGAVGANAAACEPGMAQADPQREALGELHRIMDMELATADVGGAGGHRERMFGPHHQRIETMACACSV